MEFVTVSSIQDNSEFQINVHPNPFNKQLTIETGDEIIHFCSVFTVEGHLVVSSRNTNTNRLTFDSENWNAGVYLIRLTSEKSSSTTKVLKMK